MRHSGSFKPAGEDPRRGKGGARPGAGRKSKQVIADEARAGEIAKQVLVRGLGEIIAVMRKVAKGVRRKRFYPTHHKQAGKVYYETEYDTATIRFWIERFLPAPRQGVDIAVDSPEEFYRALEAARRDKAESEKNPPIEPGDSETKVELSYDQRKKTNQ
jgi:hypothetical protein